MRISITRPMPFCPSFCPCAKLTAHDVKTSSERVPFGGGSLPGGGLLSEGLFA